MCIRDSVLSVSIFIRHLTYFSIKHLIAVCTFCVHVLIQVPLSSFPTIEHFVLFPMLPGAFLFSSLNYRVTWSSAAPTQSSISFHFQFLNSSLGSYLVSWQPHHQVLTKFIWSLFLTYPTYGVLSIAYILFYHFNYSVTTISDWPATFS